MRSSYLNKAIVNNELEFNITESLQGTTVLTPGIVFGSSEYALAGVLSNSFTTIHSVSHTIEDVGNIEVLTTGITIDFSYNGNGSVRVQLSGDGGTNWENAASVDFNVEVQTFDFFVGSGTWITSVSPGTNKLQLRLQALANAGTVNISIFDDSEFRIAYRKKVLS